MLNAKLPCLIALPNKQNKRVLIPARVEHLEGNSLCVLSFDEPVAAEVGGDVTLFAEWRNKFHQQGGKFLAIEESEGRLKLTIQRIGEPTNCESRACYRVSVVSQEINVSVGRMADCQLADVSVEGVSVITSKPLSVGTPVELAASVQGVPLAGSLRVQTEKKLPGGKLRYGLYAAEKKTPLRKQLEVVSMQMQRWQLKRLAGAA